MTPDRTRTATGAAVLRSVITDAVIAAALEVLESAGYQRLSMDEVARRAGVGKAALYRRWPGKLEMVVDALSGLSGTPDRIRAATLPDVVQELLDETVRWLSDPRTRAVLPELIAQAHRHPELARALHDHIGGPRRQWADGVLREWTPDSPAGEERRELAVDLLAAPLFWRLHQGLPLSEAYLARLADLITDALTDTGAG